MGFYKTHFLISIFFCASYAESISPEFTEPIKNITISKGSNVEFSCSVRNLGNYRIMWLKRDGSDKEKIVAINLLKIIHNPRMSVSMFQTSDEATQSTVYIRSTQEEDASSYVCAINTNPMICQIGTLDILVNKNVEEGTSKKLENEPLENETSNFSAPFDAYQNISNSAVDEKLNITQVNTDSGGGCSEIQTYWDEASDNIKEMLKSVLTSLVNFTCSFLTISQ